MHDLPPPLAAWNLQFGLSGNPEIGAEWRSKTIMDEPVKV